LLCTGLTGAGDNEDCCERKNGSIESRFHRVTPCAARAAASVIYFGTFERRIWSAVKWIRRENGITSSAGEKRALRGSVRRKQIERDLLPGLMRWNGIAPGRAALRQVPLVREARSCPAQSGQHYRRVTVRIAAP
jgi:hypothetical protein